MKTTNEHWIFLEHLRRSGIVNMFGSAPYLAAAFGLDQREASKIVSDWMRNYNPDDYDEEETNYGC